jgi:hypothetical protein
MAAAAAAARRPLRKLQSTIDNPNRRSSVSCVQCDETIHR